MKPSLGQREAVGLLVARPLAAKPAALSDKFFNCPNRESL
jgi:hypothetical protein